MTLNGIVYLLLTISFLIIPITECQDSPKETLYLLVLAPFPSKDPNYARIFSQGPAILPAVQLAVEQINNSSSLLPNHTLDIIVEDSGCNFYIETARPFVEHVILGEKPVVGIIGPTCAEAALYLAEITWGHRYGIIQAMISNLDRLENHERYRHTFGMVSSSNALIDTLLNSREHLWKNFGVIYDVSREFFESVLQSFIGRLDAIPDSHYESWPVILEPEYIPIDEIINNNRTRVVFAIVSAKTARHVACLASIKGMVYPLYQFVYADRGIDDFLNAESDFSIGEYYCNKSIIERGLNGAILLNYGLNSTDSETFLNGTAQLTVGEVKQQYKERLIELNLSETVYAYPYYDATWAFALSIDEALNKLGNFSQSNLRFLNDSREAKVMRDKFAALSFQGMSAWIQFHNITGHVTSKIEIFQVRGKEVITNDKNITYIKDEFKVNFVPLHPALIAFGLLFSVMALVMNTLLHFVNIYYRNVSPIKSTSPRLNHFIFIACYVIVFLVILQTVHYGFLGRDNTEAREFICNFAEFVHPVCLTLIVGTVTVKLWRLYSIFNRAFKTQYFLDDKYLSLIVLLLALIVISLGIPWSVYSPFEQKEIVEFTNGSETIRNIQAVCVPIKTLPLPILQLLFVSLLVMFMLLLAVLNRKIRVREFRSKESIIFAYLLTVCLGVIAALVATVYLLSLGTNIVYSAFATMLLSVVFLSDLVLFLPVFCTVICSMLPKSLQKTLSKEDIIKDRIP